MGHVCYLHGASDAQDNVGCKKGTQEVVTPGTYPDMRNGKLTVGVDFSTKSSPEWCKRPSQTVKNKDGICAHSNT